MSLLVKILYLCNLFRLLEENWVCGALVNIVDVIGPVFCSWRTNFHSFSLSPLLLTKKKCAMKETKEKITWHLFSGAELLSPLCPANVKGYSPLHKEWSCHFYYQVVRICYGEKKYKKATVWISSLCCENHWVLQEEGSVYLSTAIKLLQILNDTWEIDSFFRIIVICKKCLLSGW